jgi:hypothetical protein
METPPPPKGRGTASLRAMESPRVVGTITLATKSSLYEERVSDPGYGHARHRNVDRRDRERPRAAHAVRRVPADGRRQRGPSRTAHARQRARVHVESVRRGRPHDRRWALRARRPGRRCRRTDAGRLLGVPPDRHRGDAPRRGAVLDLLLQSGRADPADDPQLRGARRLHAAAVRLDHRRGREGGRDDRAHHRARRRRDPWHDDVGRATTSRRPGVPSGRRTSRGSSTRRAPRASPRASSGRTAR